MKRKQNKNIWNSFREFIVENEDFLQLKEEKIGLKECGLAQKMAEFKLQPKPF